MESLDLLGNPKSGDNFTIDDLFDFSNDDVFDTAVGNSTDSPTVTAVDSCNSSLSTSDDLPAPTAATTTTATHFSEFSDDLSCLIPPCEEFPELELFSRLEEESFSSEDLEKLQLISGIKAPATTATAIESPSNLSQTNNNNQIPRPEISVPGKARSKRPLATSSNWSSARLLAIVTTSSDSSDHHQSEMMTNNNYNENCMSSSGKDHQVVKKRAVVKVRKNVNNEEGGGGGEGRRCQHCATEKTPQWRTGPMGPKTLCNACGVRYKSGRLVPEYRPAASPTFVLTKHSNSHRKVMELRRQKELVPQQQRQHHHQDHHQQQLFQLYHHHHRQSNGGAMFELSGSDQEYLIHHHIGPDFRQLLI